MMNKTLQRDIQNKVIGGVCAGLANYFDIDVALVRVLFAIAFLAFSAGFWLYLVLWIVMPAGVRTGSVDENGSFVMPEQTSAPRKSRGNVVFGLILIAIGSIALLDRYVPHIDWQTAWPVALIVVGLLCLIPFGSKKP